MTGLQIYEHSSNKKYVHECSMPIPGGWGQGTSCTVLQHQWRKCRVPRAPRQLSETHYFILTLIDEEGWFPAVLKPFETDDAKHQNNPSHQKKFIWIFFALKSTFILVRCSLVWWTPPGFSAVHFLIIPTWYCQNQSQLNARQHSIWYMKIKQVNRRKKKTKKLG